MPSRPRLSVTTALAALTCLSPGCRAPASPFRYDPARAEVGTVYRYAKSNLDGSHATDIALYVAAKDRLESLKWAEGDAQATLVVAEMDWSRFSVRRFESWRLVPGKDPLLQATLQQVGDSDRLAVAIGPAHDTLAITLWPWHSYDFDLASLGFAFPHLVDPTRPFTVGIADPTPTPAGFRFLEKGPVTIAYLGDDIRNGAPTRRFRIDGPGLDNRGGMLWTAREEGHIVEFEIQLPDEPGMESGKLALKGKERLTREQWAAFQQARLRP
jgi:hypothetical protein